MSERRVDEVKRERNEQALRRRARAAWPRVFTGVLLVVAAVVLAVACTLKFMVRSHLALKYAVVVSVAVWTWVILFGGSRRR